MSGSDNSVKIAPIADIRIEPKHSHRAGTIAFDIGIWPINIVVMIV